MSTSFLPPLQLIGSVKPIFGKDKYIAPTSYYQELIRRRGGIIAPTTFWGRVLQSVGGSLPQDKIGLLNIPNLGNSYDTELVDPVYENHTIHSNDPSDRPLRIAEAIEIIAATCKKMRGVKLKDTNQIVDNKRNDLRILGEGIDNTEYFSIKQFSEQPSLLEKITGLPSRAITLAPNEVLIIREYTEVLPKGRLGSTYTDFIPAMLNQPGWSIEGKGITFSTGDVDNFDLTESRFASQEEFRTRHNGFTNISQKILIPSGNVHKLKGANESITLSKLYSWTESRKIRGLVF